MAAWRSSTLRFLLIAAVLFAVLDPSQGWLWSRRRRRRRTVTTSTCVPSPTSSFPFSYTTALRMIRYSKASYSSRQSLDLWSCSYCRYLRGFYSRSRFDRGWGTRALVGYDSTLRSVVVVFRGSKNIPNWVGNVLAWLTRFPYGSGKVHYGFLRMYRAIRSAVMVRVRALLNHYGRWFGRRVGIYVTGHSLGGALATMAAVDLKRQNSNQLTMYNFGSPRVGNAYFVRDYAGRVKRSIRVVNKNDNIPRIPSSRLGYRDVPRQVTCPSGGHSKYLGVSRKRK